jgi:hypothetical protein
MRPTVLSCPFYGVTPTDAAAGAQFGEWAGPVGTGAGCDDAL